LAKPRSPSGVIGGPQWSTSVAVVGPIKVSSSAELIWWVPLLLMSIGICVGECIWRGMSKVSPNSSGRGAASVARRKVSAPRQIRKASRVKNALIVKTLGTLDETSRRNVLMECALAMSPIQEVGCHLLRYTSRLRNIGQLPGLHHQPLKRCNRKHFLTWLCQE
jgi:hypothetical protein